MRYKRRLFFISIISFLATVTVGIVILTATNSLARGRGGGTGHIGRGSVRYAGKNLFVTEAIIDKIQEPADSYNPESTVNGSVHNSGEIIYLPPPKKQASALATMTFRPGDGVKFSAEEKKYVEAIRNSNIDDSLQTIAKELHGFLENNWPGWRGNWGDYYVDLSILANIGSTVDNLPEKHEIIKIKDLTYYYAGGVYYTKFREIYVVVPPPHGAITGTMPSEYTTVYVGNTAYFNRGGAFYIKVDNGYQVVAPPVGAIVNELPRKAYSTLIGKNVYSVYGTAHYKRFFRGNSVIYKIVKVPEVKKTVN